MGKPQRAVKRPPEALQTRKAAERKGVKKKPVAVAAVLVAAARHQSNRIRRRHLLPLRRQRNHPGRVFLVRVAQNFLRPRWTRPPPRIVPAALLPLLLVEAAGERAVAAGVAVNVAVEAVRGAVEGKAAAVAAAEELEARQEAGKAAGKELPLPLALVQVVVVEGKVAARVTAPAVLLDPQQMVQMVGLKQAKQQVVEMTVVVAEAAAARREVAVRREPEAGQEGRRRLQAPVAVTARAAAVAVTGVGAVTVVVAAVDPTAQGQTVEAGVAGAA